MAEPPSPWTAPDDAPDPWSDRPDDRPDDRPQDRTDGSVAGPDRGGPGGPAAGGGDWASPGAGDPGAGDPGRAPAPGGTGWGPPPAGDGVRAGGWGDPAGGWGDPGPGWGSPGWGGPGWGGPDAAGPAATGGPAGPGRGAGIVPLRPLTVGEIYDGAVRAIRANPRTMVGFSAVVVAVLTLLSTAPQAYALATLLNSPLADPAATDTPELSDVAALVSAGGVTLLVAVLQFVLATTIVSGLLIVAVDGAVRGLAPSPAQLWARCRGRLPALLGLALLIVVASPVLIALAVLPGVVVLLTVDTIAGVVLIVLGVIVGGLGFAALYFGFWAVAAPVLLLERVGVVAALRRSRRLVRGNFWRVLGIGLLTAVIAAVVRQLFTLPFGIVAGLVAGARDETDFVGTLVQLLISDIGTVLAGAVLFPFTSAVTALLYLDLRMRGEGMDVDLMRS